VLLGWGMLPGIAAAEEVVWRAARPQKPDAPPSGNVRQVVWKAAQAEPPESSASATGVQQAVWWEPQSQSPAPAPQVIRLSGESLALTPPPPPHLSAPPPHHSVLCL